MDVQAVQDREKAERETRKDVLDNGYWHAGGPEFLNQRISTIIEWARLPADAIFILPGGIPLFIAVIRACGYVRKAAIKTLCIRYAA